MDLLSKNRSDTSSENVFNASKTDEEKIIEAIRQSLNVKRESYGRSSLNK